jgi:hypothetical protein
MLARAQGGGRRAAEYEPARLNGGDVRDVVVPIGRDECQNTASEQVAVGGRRVGLP